ncbi:MAG: hypothetical protein L0H93_15210 [Nocardioides sp.]|nr:hypothetical protein [Nocardioides sp.]
MTDKDDAKDAERAKSAKSADEGTDVKEKSKRSRASSTDLHAVRRRVAQLVWFVCALFAVILALGALTYALNANDDNGLVEFVREWADRLDLGIFSLENGIKEFAGKNSEVKNALVNWGLGAIFWLVIGRVADKGIRP